MAVTGSKSETRSVKTAETPAPSVSESDLESRIDALQKEIEELRRHSQYRSVFLSRLAHELRTPLTSILGFSEIMLSQEKLTAAQRNFCERIQNSAQQLQSSLNQLSDLARLESGQTKLAYEKFSLLEALQETLPALTRRAEKKRIKVSCEGVETLPPVICDRGRLRQVIFNLVAYAIARSPEGGSVVAFAETNDGRLGIFVKDDGEHLANPSEIGTLNPADDKSGSGELGLAIARQNVQLLGGVIGARNLDAGLEVRIDLPLDPPSELRE